MQASSADAVRDKEAAGRERSSMRSALEQLQQEVAGALGPGAMRPGPSGALDLAGAVRQQQSGSGDMAARLRTLQQRLADQELQLTSAQADSQVCKIPSCLCTTIFSEHTPAVVGGASWMCTGACTATLVKQACHQLESIADVELQLTSAHADSQVSNSSRMLGHRPYHYTKEKQTLDGLFTVGKKALLTRSSDSHKRPS